MSSKRKVENIQALRGVAILSVMLFHLSGYEARLGGNRLHLSALLDAGNAGVDLFFLISGFVMIVTAADRYRGVLGAGDFLYRRATRIYPLYWFFTLLILPLFLKHPEMVNSSQAIKPSLWKSFALWPQQASPLVAQGWTLIHEMYFYVVFALLLQLPQQLLGVALIAWAAVVTIGQLQLQPQPSQALLGLILNPLTLEFILGCLVAMAIQRGVKRFGPICMVIGAVGFLAAAFIGVEHDHPWQRVLWFGVPSVFLLYGAAASEAKHSLRLPRPLSYIGDISYSMYLSHGLVLAAMAKLWWKLAPSNIALNLLGSVVLIGATVVVATLSYRLIERPLQNLTRRKTPAAKPNEVHLTDTARQPELSEVDKPLEAAAIVQS